jgi:DHHC palmitoyltransferase
MHEGERFNGFSLPLKWKQVLVWLFVIFQVYCMVHIKLMTLFQYYKSKLDLRAQSQSSNAYLAAIVVLAVFAMIFAFVLLQVVCYGYICTRDCPTDPAVHKQRNLALNGKEHTFNHKKASQTGECLPLYCTVCEKFVEESTKHCGTCNRCVFGFDHHCEWLNNCIGKTNYATFRNLLACFLSLLLLSLSATMAMIITGNMNRRDL